MTSAMPQSADMIVRHVKVDRTRTPQVVIDATGGKQYTDREVLDGMPCGEGDEADVYFFKPELSEYTRPGYISDEDVGKALSRRGLTSDPYAQAQVNIDDPAFADEHPNGTQWKVPNGKWHYTSFRRWGRERSVYVERSVSDWGDDWWFAGIRK